MGINLCCRTTSVFFKAVVSGRSSIAVGGQCDSQGVQGKLIFCNRCICAFFPCLWLGSALCRSLVSTVSQEGE